MLLKQTTLITITILISLISYEVNAWSCSPMNDRIIAHCKGMVCNELIFVSDVKSFGRCTRRPEIIDPPEWAKSVIEYEIKANDFIYDEGIYELALIKKTHLPNRDIRNAEEYIKIIESNDTPCGDYINLRKFRQFKKLNETSLQSIQQDWKSKGKDKYHEELILRIIDWSSLIVSFVLLIFSMYWFIQWINGTKKMQWLVLSLTIQSLIMYFTISTMNSSDTYMIVFLGVLLPGLWLSEIVLFSSTLINRYKSQADKSKE